MSKVDIQLYRIGFEKKWVTGVVFLGDVAQEQGFVNDSLKSVNLEPKISCPRRYHVEKAVLNRNRLFGRYNFLYTNDRAGLIHRLDALMAGREGGGRTADFVAL